MNKKKLATIKRLVKQGHKLIDRWEQARDNYAHQDGYTPPLESNRLEKELNKAEADVMEWAEGKVPYLLKLTLELLEEQ